MHNFHGNRLLCIYTCNYKIKPKICQVYFEKILPLWGKEIRFSSFFAALWGTDAVFSSFFLQKSPCKNRFFHIQSICAYRKRHSCFSKTLFLCKNKNPTAIAAGLFSAGAANQSRTDDLILTKDVLYQLSHSSKQLMYYSIGVGICQEFF